jgi:hypothetical protein
MYKAMHGQLDLSLPHIKEVNRALSAEDVDHLDYDWLESLSTAYTANEAEHTAKKVLWEQISRHPQTHLIDMIETFFSFGTLYETPGNDRFAVRLWFAQTMRDIENIHSLAMPPPREISRFLYVATGRNTPLIWLWNRLGVWYMNIVPAVLFVSFFLLTALFALYRSSDQSRPTTRNQDYAIWVCGTAYLLTVLGHVLTLTDNDRYIASLSFLSVLVVLCIVAYFLESWHTQYAVPEEP